MGITVKVKDVYGKRTIYPVDEAAKQFAAIAGTKTLTQSVIDHIKTLGYEIKVEQSSL